MRLRIVFRVGDDGGGFGDLQPVGDRVRAEQDGGRDRDEPRLPAGDMCDCGHRILRQQNQNAVALLQAGGDKCVRELVRHAVEFAKGDLADRAVGALMDQRDLGGIGDVTVADIARDVVALGNMPAERVVDFPVCVATRQHSLHRDPPVRSPSAAMRHYNPTKTWMKHCLDRRAPLRTGRTGRNGFLHGGRA